MKFDEAVEALERGLKVTRKKWGHDVCLVAAPGAGIIFLKIPRENITGCCTLLLSDYQADDWEIVIV